MSDVAPSPSAPPATGTRFFDLLPTELIVHILSYLEPHTIEFRDDGRRCRATETNTLFAVQQTCERLHPIVEPFLWKNIEVRLAPSAVPNGEVSRPSFLEIIDLSPRRARGCRKVVCLGTDAPYVFEWSVYLPNVEEVVLSGTPIMRPVELAAFARFTRLRSLAVDVAILVPVVWVYIKFPRLECLALHTVSFEAPFLETIRNIGSSIMPALRNLSIANCRVLGGSLAKPFFSPSLISQLDCLEVGADQHPRADVRHLVPIANLPPTLHVLWHVDLACPDPPLFASPTIPASTQRAFLRLDLPGPYPLTPDARLAFLTKMRALLASVIDLRLVLVPVKFWCDPVDASAQGPSSLTIASVTSPATVEQRAIEAECAARGVELRTYVPVASGGVAPEFKAFLREQGLEGGTRRA